MVKAEDLENVLEESAENDDETIEAPGQADDKITLSMVWSLLKSSVVEPYLILFMFAYTGRGLIVQSLFTDKACLVHLGFDESICKNLTAHQDHLNQVQKVANNYHMVSSLMGLLPAIITNLFLSSWSDVYGRKIPIAIASTGVILDNIGLMWNTANFDAPMGYLLLPSIPSGLLGGVMVVVTSSMSYITDVTDIKLRVIRFAMFEMAFTFSSPIGTAVCGVIFEKSGYMAVFSTTLVCTIVGLIYLCIRLKETNKRKLGNIREAFQSLFSLANVKENMKTCVKERPGTIRKEIWLTFLAMFCYILNMMGLLTTEYFFVKKMYGWTTYKLSMVNMVVSFGKAFAIMIAIPILVKKIKISDTILAIIGILSSMAVNVQKAVSYKEWLYYYASLTGLLSGLTGIGTRARLSKLVSKDEIAKVFSVLILCESLAPVLGILGFAQIYNSSVDFFPGLAYCLSGTLLIVPLVVNVWITRYASSAPYKNQRDDHSQELPVDSKIELDSATHV